MTVALVVLPRLIQSIPSDISHHRVHQQLELATSSEIKRGISNKHRESTVEQQLKTENKPNSLFKLISSRLLKCHTI